LPGLLLLCCCPAIKKLSAKENTFTLIKMKLRTKRAIGNRWCISTAKFVWIYAARDGYFAVRIGKPALGKWQLAQDCPEGSDRLLSKNTCLPRACFSIRSGSLLVLLAALQAERAPQSAANRRLFMFENCIY